MTLSKHLRSTPLFCSLGTSRSDRSRYPSQPFPRYRASRTRREPRRRWTIPEISRRLNPVAAAAAAAQSFLLWLFALIRSCWSLRKAGKCQSSTHLRKSASSTPRLQAANPPRQTLFSPTNVVPVAAVAFWLSCHLLRSENPRPSSDGFVVRFHASARPRAARSDRQPALRETGQLRAVRKKNIRETRLAENRPEKPCGRAAEFGEQRQLLLLCAPIRPIRKRASASASSSERGEVLERFCPRSPRRPAPPFRASCASASASRRPTGNVSEASLDSAGPSKYFADLALKPAAAGNSLHPIWAVTASQRMAHPASNSRRTGPKAFPTQ